MSRVATHMLPLPPMDLTSRTLTEATVPTPHTAPRRSLANFDAVRQYVCLLHALLTTKPRTRGSGKTSAHAEDA
jgi:hypothetical protein